MQSSNNGLHPVLTRAILNPDTLPLVSEFNATVVRFLHATDVETQVASEVSYERLLYHQLCAYYGIKSKPIIKGAPEIILTKPEGFDLSTPDVARKLAELGRMLESASRSLSVAPNLGAEKSTTTNRLIDGTLVALRRAAKASNSVNNKRNIASYPLSAPAGDFFPGGPMYAAPGALSPWPPLPPAMDPQSLYALSTSYLAAGAGPQTAYHHHHQGPIMSAPGAPGGPHGHYGMGPQGMYGQASPGVNGVYGPQPTTPGFPLPLGLTSQAYGAMHGMHHLSPPGGAGGYLANPGHLLPSPYVPDLMGPQDAAMGLGASMAYADPTLGTMGLFSQPDMPGSIPRPQR